VGCNFGADERALPASWLKDSGQVPNNKPVRNRSWSSSGRDRVAAAARARVWACGWRKSGTGASAANASAGSCAANARSAWRIAANSLFIQVTACPAATRSAASANWTKPLTSQPQTLLFGKAPALTLRYLRLAPVSPCCSAATYLAVPYAGLPQEYAPFQRFGISVTGSPLAEGLARQGRARLSAAVTILPWAYPGFAHPVGIQTVAPSATLNSPSVLIAPYRAALLVLDHEATGGVTCTANIQVSPPAQGTPTNWQPIGTVSLTRADGTATPQIGQLYCYHLRVQIVAGSGGVDFAAAVMLAR